MKQFNVMKEEEIKRKEREMAHEKNNEATTNNNNRETSRMVFNLEDSKEIMDKSSSE